MERITGNVIMSRLRNHYVVTSTLLRTNVDNSNHTESKTQKMKGDTKIVHTVNTEVIYDDDSNDFSILIVTSSATRKITTENPNNNIPDTSAPKIVSNVKLMNIRLKGSRKRD